MTNNRKRRLIYHLYIPNYTNWRELTILNLHFNCLKEYSNIFTESLFVISLDNIDDNNLIQEIEQKIISCGYHNVQFKVVENTILYETKTLYEELINKMGQLDGLTFFGHSKGVGNELYGACNMEPLKDWVSGLYYFSLAKVNDVECQLYGVWGTTYGPFKTKGVYDNKYNWIYSGTFFWINCQRLQDKIERENLTIRKPSNRFCSELFLGDLLDMELKTTPQETCSFNSSYIMNANNYYDDVAHYIKIITNEEDLKKFEEFKNKMLTNNN